MSPKELTPEEGQRIYAVKTYLINHLTEAFSLQQISKMAALGEQKFKDGFCRLFEMHTGEYIHATRMQTGKFLLLHTEKSIKEIALICGYAEARNFSSAYKKFFGERPSAARL